MKTGDIVYLCETQFSKFRELFEWIRSAENKNYKDHLKSKNDLIKNEFYITAYLDNKILISLENENLDDDMVGRCSRYKIEALYTNLNQNEIYVSRSLPQTTDEIRRLAIINKSNYEYVTSFIILRNYLFLFDLSQITLLSDIK